MNIKELKTDVKATMKDTTPSPILVGLLYSIVLYLISAIGAFITSKVSINFGRFLISLITLWLNCVVAYSFIWYKLKVYRKEYTNYLDLFCAKDRWITVVGLSLLTSMIYTVFGFIAVVGIFIPLYNIRLAPYIIHDEKCSAHTAVIRSIQLMKGHRMELFKLDISFIGWGLLCLITGGLASIYVNPYAGITYAGFYDYVINNVNE